MLTFDCVIIVDCHVSRSAERRLFALLDAHADSGVSTGLIAMHRDWYDQSWLRSQKAQRRLLDGRFSWIDPTLPCRTGLALVLSPGLAGFGRNRALRLVADRVVVWPIEATLGPDAQRPSALRDQAGRLQTILDAPVAWAARSRVEHRFLAERLPASTLEPEVWWPLMRVEAPTERPPSAGPWTVGRHFGGRGQLGETALAEWQDTWLEPWPMTLALLGDLEFLQSLPQTAVDQAVRHDESRLQKLDDFLGGLDLFVAIGDDPEPWRLQEEVLEALAAGLVVIAPPATAAGFDGALVSAEACFLGDLAAGLSSDHAAFLKARCEQQASFERRHGASAYRRRLASAMDERIDAPPLVLSGKARQPGRVLLISDDSRYLEHLPRQLAIARHLQAPLKPYFLTMARDAALVERMGFPCEYLLPHTSPTYRALFDRAEAWDQSLNRTYRTLLDKAEMWNQNLARHLRELIAFLDARAVVFDGMFPFAGLAEVCTQHPNLPFAWIRRGLWQADAEEGGLVRSGLFDLVIEPGELADAFDHGPTRKHRERVVLTRPIRLGRLEAPARARFELGLGEDQLCGFLHPSVSGDQRAGDALSELLQRLADGGCRFWTTDPIPDAAPQTWPIDVIRLDNLAARRQLAAFDIAIGGADYRSAHDSAAAGLPTVFLPDSGKPTDDQATRAAIAARDGWAIVLARGDVYGARAAARRLLDPGVRQVMSGLCTGKDDAETSGAEQAALAISQMIYSLDMTPPSAWRKAAG